MRWSDRSTDVRRLSLAFAALCCLAIAVAAPARADDLLLTPHEQARIVALVEGDPRIRATVGDADVRVEDVLPWSVDGTRRTLIGGGVTLTFATPQTVEADWSLMDFPNGPDEYAITTMHYRVEDADAIDAWVDLRENRLVSFDVLGGTVDEKTIRPVTASRSGVVSGSRDDDAAGPPRNTMLACALLASLLASALVLGFRYGHHSSID